MAELPYLQLWVDRWMGSESVGLMPLAAQGLYTRLLCVQWRNGSLPVDVAQVARLAGVDRADFTELWPHLEHLFPVQDGRMANLILAEQRAKALSSSETRSTANSGNARARWAKAQEADANGMPIACEPDANGNADGTLRASSSSSSSSSTREGESEGAPKVLRVQGSILDHLPEDYATEDLQEAWASYERHRKEKGIKGYTPEALKTLAGKFLKAGVSPAGVVELISKAVSSNWQGIPHEAITRAGQRKGPGGPMAPAGSWASDVERLVQAAEGGR